MSTKLAPLPAIYCADEVRSIETLARVEPQATSLMERAGLAAAELSRDLLTDNRKPLLLFAGLGNNGGDAFVVARHLQQWWHRVAVVFAGDPEHLPDDAREAFERWRTAGGETLSAPPHNIAGYGLIIDGLFGIGLQRELRGVYAELVEQINRSGAPVLALDIPTGLHADSGRILGCAVRAQHTVTFIALKPGLLTLDGPDLCGELHVRDLGVEAERLVPPRARLLDATVLVDALPPRPLSSHKGTFGSVGIIGGAPGMTGAALLAGRAALKLGTGRVYVGLLDGAAPRFDVGQPELMLRQAEEVLGMADLNCLVLGPGLSRSAAAANCVQRALQSDAALVIDADALNLIGANPELQEACRLRTGATIMTPHPAEAARLRGTSTAQIQADRVASAVALARQYRAIVALKGVGTIVAMPDRNFFINRSGNPGLASAGMGDVLSGLVAALVAQGADPTLATCVAVHLHGAAADRLYEEVGGPIGLTASEILDTARTLLNRAIYRGSGPTLVQ